MLRSFRSAKGEDGAAGSTRGAAGSAAGGREALVCDVETDALVGADRASVSRFGITATFVRTIMLVLTWMVDLRGTDCGWAFDRAAGSALSSCAATATD